MNTLQLAQFFPVLNELQLVHGDKGLFPAYGAGCTNNPLICFVFMNPTAKNVSTRAEWTGLRAPWVGTKNIWKLLSALHLIDQADFEKIQAMKPSDWTADFVVSLYQSLVDKRVYITNLGKCTQLDARALPDKVLQAYLEHTYAEVAVLQPKHIVTFGNQVSSIFLQKKVSVSQYLEIQSEQMQLNDQILNVYPTYYPVGLGMRNIDKAIARVASIIAQA